MGVTRDTLHAPSQARAQALRRPRDARGRQRRAWRTAASAGAALIIVALGVNRLGDAIDPHRVQEA